MRPVTIEDGRVVTHGPTTNSGSASSSASSSPDGRVVTHGEPERRSFDHSDPALLPVWMPGFGPCLCADCQRKQTAMDAARAEQITAAGDAMPDDTTLIKTAELESLRSRLATAEAERAADKALLDALDVAPFALRTYLFDGRRYTVAHSARVTATMCTARDAIRAVTRPPTPGDTP